MPSVIVKSSYMTERTHIANYIRYIATREGVEQLKPSVLYRTATVRQQAFIAEHKTELASLEEYKKFQEAATINTASRLITAYAKQAVNASQDYREYARTARESEGADDTQPATEKQIQFVDKHLEEAEGLPEYQDYLKNRTVGNASALIGMIAEQHPTDPTIYMKYIAERPGVEKAGAWDGLFDLSGKANLNIECDRILDSQSVVWAHIISLRREDAARVGMDYAEAWRKQIAAEAPEIAKLYHISLTNMHVLGAFHNEGHHPHVHVLVYSDDPEEGVISKKHMKGTGQKMRSILTNAIFREDLAPVKAQKTQARDEMRQRIQEYKNALYGKNVKILPDIIKAMRDLSEHLPVTGKKQYAFLPKKVKAYVNDTLRLITQKDPTMAKLAETYFSSERKLIEQYHDDKQVVDAKCSESMKRFYEPQTGKYAKGNDTAAIQNSIVHWAYAIHEELHTGHLHYPKEKPFGKAEVAAEKTDEPEALLAHLSAYRSEKDGEWEESLKEPPIRTAGQYSINSKPEALPVTDEQISREFAIARRQYRNGMSLLHDHGKTENQDKKEAFKLIQSAADRCHTMAQYRTACMLRDGTGVEQNDFQSDAYFHKAFRGFSDEVEIRDTPFAHYQLGKMYQNGEACFQDMSKAMEHYEAAADQGNLQAGFVYGKLLLDGKGSGTAMEQFEKGVTYLEYAAEQGHAGAAFVLGEMYLENGDDQTALPYFQSAADAGNRQAGAKLQQMQNDEQAADSENSADKNADILKDVPKRSDADASHKKSVEDVQTDSVKPEALPVLESNEPVVDIQPDTVSHDENHFPEITNNGSGGTTAVAQVHDTASSSNVSYMVLRMLRDVAGIIETNCNNDNMYARQNRKRGSRSRQQSRQNKKKDVQKEWEANYER